MQLGTHHRSPSHLAIRLVLLIALAVTSLTLTHCRMVGDRLTGVNVAPFSRAGDCVKRCNEQSNAQLKAENDLHKLLFQNCNADPVCEAAEDARHEAAVTAINLARNNCKNECHKQGGGSGGQ